MLSQNGKSPTSHLYWPHRQALWPPLHTWRTPRPSQAAGHRPLPLDLPCSAHNRTGQIWYLAIKRLTFVINEYAAQKEQFIAIARTSSHYAILLNVDWAISTGKCAIWKFELLPVATDLPWTPSHVRFPAEPTLPSVSKSSWHFWIVCQMKNVTHFWEIFIYIWIAKDLVNHVTRRKSENNLRFGKHFPLFLSVWKLSCARIGCRFWLSDKSPA